MDAPIVDPRHPLISRKPGVCGGKACIDGHRVRVLDIVWWHDRLGLSADEIVHKIPSISATQVHAAMAYYFEHVGEVNDEMHGEVEVVRAAMERHPSLLAKRLGLERLSDLWRPGQHVEAKQRDAENSTVVEGS